MIYGEAGRMREDLALALREARQELVQSCPRLRRECYWAVDVMFVVDHSESLKGLARRALATLDELLLTERLLNWTDHRIAADLKSYPGVDPGRASQARDLLLSWLGQ